MPLLNRAEGYEERNTLAEMELSGERRDNMPRLMEAQKDYSPQAAAGVILDLFELNLMNEDLGRMIKSVVRFLQNRTSDQKIFKAEVPGSVTKEELIKIFGMVGVEVQPGEFKQNPNSLYEIDLHIVE